MYGVEKRLAQYRYLKLPSAGGVRRVRKMQLLPSKSFAFAQSGVQRRAA
jgi:hypothetical protein